MLKTNQLKIGFLGLLLLIVFSFFPNSVNAQKPFSKQAQWITVSDATNKPNQWICFRKNFKISQLPKKSNAKIAVDSKYWLWINGKLIVHEGGLKRGPNPDDTYYDEVDLTKYLQIGQNTIAILVWYFGKNGFSHKSSGKAGLLFETPIGQTNLVSNATWMAQIHPSFGETKEPFPNYRLSESNVHFDARKELINWFSNTYNDSKWQSASEIGQAGIEPWNQFVLRPIPQWQLSDLLNYVSQRKVSTPKGDSIIAKLPKNLSILPYLKINASEGQLIDMRTDNYKGGSEYNVRSEYLTRTGDQEFESPAYFNGHEVRYFLPKGIKVIALKYRETRYNTQEISTFHCDDEFLNKLRQKAVNTLNLNLREVISDCPDRERAAWMADATINFGEIFYTYDAQSHDLIRKTASEFVNWQRPDSTLYFPVPNGAWKNELPSQVLATISTYGFWNYYRFTNDTATLKMIYPNVKKYLSLWKLDTNGLVKHRKGGWDWTDWGENIDVPVIENCWYYMALDASAKTAKLLGFEADTTEYSQKMQSIRGNFNHYFWDGKQYRSANYKGPTDDRGHGMAVVSGLAESSQYEAIKKILNTEYHASPYLEKYILEAFFMMQDARGGIARIKKRYKEMVDSPLTTLWEGWSIGDPKWGGGTYNHGWTGGPLTLMSEYIAGISPLSSGYKRFKIFPQIGNLNLVQAKVETPLGFIEVKIQRTKNELVISTKTPPTISGIISIPIHENIPTQISCNGKVIFKDEKYLGGLKEVELIPGDEHYFNFEVRKGGNYEFKAVF
jgi:alpha-L-rhamnosidase